MKGCRNLWLFMIAGMQILRGPLGALATDNPCPGVFRYEGSPGSEYGIITLPIPYPYIAIDISVEMYITGPVPQTSNIKLQPVDKDMWWKLAGGSRDPILFRLDFPVSSPLPTIKSITVNQFVVCRGRKPDSTLFTTMTIQHAVFNKTCQSASLDCPDNIKQSPLEPPPPPPQPPQSPSQTATAENIGGSDCGLPVVRRNALVFGGWVTEHGAWPWHVALYHHTGYDTIYRCGGSFVGTRTIITAAHCFYTPAGERLPDEDFTVFLGRYNLKKSKEEGAQEKDVSRIFVHPAFNFSILEANVAIIVLKRPVQITAQVRPVCLWSSRDTGLESIVDRNGTVAGWGLDEKGMTAEMLKMVNMPVVSQETCLLSHPEFFKMYSHKTTFCAGMRNGNSVCNGDSGGGLMFQDGPRGGGGVWRIRGIVSNSREDDFVKRRCDLSSYVLFTDLAPYLNWIENLVL